MKKTIVLVILLTLLLLTSVSLSANGSNNESPTIIVEYPSNNTTFHISQNISIIGYAIDDIGIVDFGYSVAWNENIFTEIKAINVSKYYEFELPVMIYNGRNEITLHAIDTNGSWGNETIIVFFQNYDRILYVDDDGGADFTRIQDAVDNAHDGDTVYVYSGIYSDYFPDNYACVSIKNRINVVGEDKDTTIINGTGFQRVVYIWSNNVNFSGFTIQHGENLNPSGWVIGIDIFHGIINSNIHIYDNIIKNCQYGIYIEQYSEGFLIYNNLIFNNYIGVSCGISSKGDIFNNIISQNEQGIISDSNAKISFFNNLVSNNSIGLASGLNYIYFNIIRDNELGIRLYSYQGTTIQCNNFINNDDQTYLTKGFLLIQGRNKNSCFWNDNYWDDWNKRGPKSIRGYGSISIIILRIHPKLTTTIKIASFPYFEFDWNPSQEPFDIKVGIR